MCNVSSDCTNFPIYYCHHISPFESECVHKGLFPGMDRWDVLATTFCFFGSMVAASSGVGGGGLFVPILLLVGKFTPHLATMLSSIIVFGASVSNVAIAVFQKHPDADRPMIDYDVSLLMTPVVLAGGLVGVLFNVMFPNWLILTLLLLLLLVTVVRTTQKGVKEFRDESRAFRVQKEAVESLPEDQMDQKVSILDHGHVDSQFEEKDIEMTSFEMSHPINDVTLSLEPSVLDGETSIQVDPLSDVVLREESIYYNDEIKPEDSVENAKSSELEALLLVEKKRIPWLKWCFLAGCWIVLLLSSFLKGGKKSPSLIPGITPCGVWFWLIEAITFPILLIVTILAGVWLRRRHAKKVALNYKFVKGDIQWNTKNALMIPVFCVFAGIMAGLLGLGGGMIIGPIFLELGVLSHVAANTSSFIIFLTVSSTVVQFAFLGVLPFDYAIWFFGFGILSSLIGQLLILRIIKIFKRTSFVVLLLSFTIFISTILMLTVGIWDVTLDIINGAYMGFRSTC